MGLKGDCSVQDSNKLRGYHQTLIFKDLYMKMEADEREKLRQVAYVDMQSEMSKLKTKLLKTLNQRSILYQGVPSNAYCTRSTTRNGTYPNSYTKCNRSTSPYNIYQAAAQQRGPSHPGISTEVCPVV